MSTFEVRRLIGERVYVEAETLQQAINQADELIDEWEHIATLYLGAEGQHEHHYCWRELRQPEGEDRPRLLIPWSDPHQYEYPADGLFDTEQQARSWKAEAAPDEDWMLCYSIVVSVQPPQPASNDP